MVSSLVYTGIVIPVVYVCISILLWSLQPPEATEEDLRRQRHAVIVVLGDLGHSPRMSFHALSIAKCGWRVSLVGYADSKPMNAITSNPSIDVIPLPSPPARGRFYLLYAINRAVFEHVTLYRVLRKLPKPDVVLVQNPPSIPALGVCRIFTMWTRPGTKLLIDWHNLGYSILALRQRWVFVIAYRAYEMIFGRIAYLHLAVSRRLGFAISRNLLVNPKRIMPLPDRPLESHVASEREKRGLRTKYADLIGKGSRLVVTSTSYTPDEDLGMLLEALEAFDEMTSSQITVVVTGKGPGATEFESQVSSLRLKNITIRTAWLSYEGYHELLSLADIGISLHSSSSGWDLPMKVVDMFGAGVPVLALSFPALQELVQQDKNGLEFKDSEDLANALDLVLTDDDLYYKLKAGALAEAQRTWDTQWQEKLGPVFGQGSWGTNESDTSDSE